MHPSAAPGSLQELEQQQQQGQQQQQQQVWGPDSTYFNSGLLLYNMPAWRQHCETVKAELLQLGFRVLTAGQTAAGTNCDSALRADNPHKPFGPKLGGGSSATGCSSSQIVPICSNGGSKSSTISTKPALLYHDQDALNLLCCNTPGWQELDHRWNVQVRGTAPQPEKCCSHNQYGMLMRDGWSLLTGECVRQQDPEPDVALCAHGVPLAAC